MIELKVPFYREYFGNHKEYREAREKYLLDLYVDKEVIFDHELIGISGLVLHEKGKTVIVRGIDCDCFKISNLSGEPIYGLYRTSCFTLKV